MSVKEAEEFIKKMDTDDAFRVEVTKITDVKELREYINQRGFSFTSDELHNAWLAMSKTKPSPTLPSDFSKAASDITVPTHNTSTRNSPKKHQP